MIKTNLANRYSAIEAWNKIPKEHQIKILKNVWCSRCREKTTIQNFKPTLKGSLVLYGTCYRCNSTVCRNIEE